jgi:threonine/homoserine efflux transporter RhtA
VVCTQIERMADFTEKLSHTELLGVCMAFGAGIGMSFGFSLGLLFGDTLVWGPMGIALGVAMAFLFWVGLSNQEEF